MARATRQWRAINNYAYGEAPKMLAFWTVEHLFEPDLSRFERGWARKATRLSA
ncbi:uncharacterized protein G2W53_007897 [Senna tora]|uniref:Uncharacterized protein n=1 Tax=Senna tora TaxID=362788 RepID=A0A835CG96_9FABA|nr:uncharacterized protein G2W53_007897 [Senna tora]